MVKLNLEHVLILAIVAFLLYYLTSRCNLNNGFSIGRLDNLQNTGLTHIKSIVIYLKK